MSDVRIAGASFGIQSTQVTARDSATALLSGTRAIAQRRSLYIFNNNVAGGAVLFVGGTTVTAALGTPIPAQSGLALDMGPNLTAYGICTAGNTADVRLLELA